MKIEEVSLEKLSDLVALFDNYMVFYGQPSNPERYQFYLKERLEKNEATFYLAYENNKALGFVTIYTGFSSVSLGKILILNDLYVLPEGRKKGIGRLLIEKTFELAKNTNAIRIDLETAKDNFNAQKLYENIGFIRDDEFYSYSFKI